MTKGSFNDTAKVQRMVSRLLKLPRISIQTTRNLEQLKQQLEKEMAALKAQGERRLIWRRSEDDQTGSSAKRPYQAPQVGKFRNLQQLPIHQRQVAEEIFADLGHIETIVDKDHRWVSVTESFGRLLGYGALEMIGQKVDDFTVEESTDIDLAFQALYRVGEMDGLWMFWHRDGTQVLVHYHARVDSGFSHAEIRPLLVA